MRKCTGNNTQEWGPEAIFTIECESCGHPVEFFQDELARPCAQCGQTIRNERQDYGCGQWCSSASTHMRSYCSKFKKSKARFHGHLIT